MSLTTVKDITDQVMKSIHAMSKQQVLIGIPADAKARPDDAWVTNAQLGYLHEFGSPARNIPARPFLIPGVKAATERCEKILKDSARHALSHDTNAIERGLNQAGLMAQASVKQTLKQGEGFAPLKESTLQARRRKGFKGESPLIRTGQLLNSITYVVRDQ
jgi:phage gpG-like protein